MQNVLIGWNNRIDAATLAGGSFETNLPRDNLKDGNISKVARTTDDARASTRFSADLGANYAVRALALVNHNLSSAARWRARAGVVALPTLDFNFETGEADAALTASGGANGTRVNAAGGMVAASAPRVNFDRATLACKGLLVEAARTNKCTNFNANPTDLTNVGYGGDPALVVSVVDDSAALAAAGLGGVCTSGKVYKADNSLAAGGSFIAIDGLSGNTNVHVASAWARVTGGTATIEQAGGVGFVAFTNGAYELVSSTPLAAPSSSGQLAMGISAGAVLYFVLNQYEESAHPTSTIPIAGAAVTRTADAVSATSTFFSSAASAVAGTLYAEFSLEAVTGTRPILGLDNNSANERIELYASGTDLKMKVVDGGSTVVDLTIGTVAANTFYKAAIAWAANDFAACLSGGTVATDGSGTLPTLDRMRLGADQAGNYMNGHIKRAALWAARLTNAQLQALTTSGPAGLGMTDTGWVNALQMTFVGDTPSNWGKQYYALACMDTTARYLSVEVDDTANADGYVQIGRVFVGGGFQPSLMNMETGMRDGRKSLDDVVTAVSGKEYGTVRRRRKTVAFSLPMLTEEEGDHLHEMQDFVGLTEEVLVVHDPDDLAQSQRYGMLGLMEDLDPIAYPFFATRSNAMQIKEKL